MVDVKKKEINMGEAKILGDRIIFNITPSPGASVCLKNSENDALKVCSFLGVESDSVGFNSDYNAKDL